MSTAETRPRKGPPRRFDHEEARRLYATGEWTWQRLGDKYGVSAAAIGLAVNPQLGARVAANHAKWQRQARCPDCGAQTTRVRKGQNRRCPECRALKRATSVRDGELQCQTCREWKPDEEFPRDAGGRAARRGRHSQCRRCGVAARIAWRAKNREKDRAYDRARRRKMSVVRVSDCGSACTCVGCGARRGRYHRRGCPLDPRQAEEAAATTSSNAEPNPVPA